MAPHLFRILEFREYDVIVPLICHRCGNCCRKYHPSVEPELLPEIGRILRKPIHEIQSRLREDCEAYHAGSPKDCCFFNPADNTCSIHEIKPEPCRVFPSPTEAGAGNVDCPGHKEHMNVVNEFLKDGRFLSVRNPSSSRGARGIPAGERPNIMKKLVKANASENLVRNFIEVNK
ncbi:MAG: YkgJ family cysteine cluster protein [Syntrophales bacterium]